MQLLVQQLSPEPSKHGFGIVTLETESYVLQAYRPETGVQFFVTADLKTENLAAFLVSLWFALSFKVSSIGSDQAFYFIQSSTLDSEMCT